MNREDLRRFLAGIEQEDFERLHEDLSLSEEDELILGTDMYEEYLQELIHGLKTVKKSMKSRTKNGKFYRKEADRIQSAIGSLNYLNRKSQRKSKELLDNNQIKESFDKNDIREFIRQSKNNNPIQERATFSGFNFDPRNEMCEFDMTQLNFPIAAQLTNKKTQQDLQKIGRFLGVPKSVCDALNLASGALGLFFGESGDDTIEGKDVKVPKDLKTQAERDLKDLHLRKVFEDARSKSDELQSYNENYSDSFNLHFRKTSERLKSNRFLYQDFIEEMNGVNRKLKELKDNTNESTTLQQTLNRIDEISLLSQSSRWSDLRTAIEKLIEKTREIPPEQSQYVQVAYNYQMVKLYFKLLQEIDLKSFKDDIEKILELPNVDGIKVEKSFESLRRQIETI